MRSGYPLVTHKSSLGYIAIAGRPPQTKPHFRSRFLPLPATRNRNLTLIIYHHSLNSLQPDFACPLVLPWSASRVVHRAGAAPVGGDVPQPRGTRRLLRSPSARTTRRGGRKGEEVLDVVFGWHRWLSEAELCGDWFQEATGRSSLAAGSNTQRWGSTRCHMGSPDSSLFQPEARATHHMGKDDDGRLGHFKNQEGHFHASGSECRLLSDPVSAPSNVCAAAAATWPHMHDSFYPWGKPVLSTLGHLPAYCCELIICMITQSF